LPADFIVTVDKFWHVPHFEKMLYDQAQLVISYLTAHQLTKRPPHAEAARNVLDYVAEQMTSPGGGFYSAEDADSLVSAGSKKKAEGAFYVWEKKEIEGILGEKSAKIFNHHYNVQEEGNAPPGSDPHHEFTNKNILIEKSSIEATAKSFDLGVQETKDLLESAKQQLKQVRAKRPRPFLDDKIITAWNALMIQAFARASRVLDDPHYLDLATRATGFIRRELYKNGELIRNYREGASNIRGFADDYAFLISALIELYEVSGDVSHLSWAFDLQRKMDELFWDKDGGGYFSTALGDDSLVLRMKEEYDGAEPSPNSFAAMNLVKLGAISYKPEYLEKAKRTMKQYEKMLVKAPIVFPHMVAAMDTFFHSPKQVIIAGDPKSASARAMLKAAYGVFDPYRVILHADNGEGQSFLRSLGLEYVSEGSMAKDDKATAYVCQNFTCSLPTNDLADFEKIVSAR